MYCFNKMCCMCLKTAVNKKNLKSIRNKCKDNISILEKINFIFPKKIQLLVKCVLPDAVICNTCRGNIVRSYKFIHQCVDNFDIIKRYAEQLGHSYSNTADLSVCLNKHTSKNKGVKCNVDKKYNFSVPATIEKENIHNTLEDFKITKGEYNSKQETATYDIDIKTETQNEEMEYLVTETTLKSEITIKDEYSTDINKHPDDVSFLQRFIKENDIDDSDSMAMKTEAMENYEMNSLSFTNACYKSITK